MPNALQIEQQNLEELRNRRNYSKGVFLHVVFLLILLQNPHNLPALCKVFAGVLCTLSFNYYKSHTPELYTAKMLPWSHKEVKLFSYHSDYMSYLQHSKPI